MKYQDFKFKVTSWLLEWGMHSDHCVELLAMICAHESAGGKHRRQLISEDGKLVAKGKARGLFGIEPPTHDSTWDNSDTINARAAKHGIQRSDADRLIDDDMYSVWVARHYLAMDKNPLPKTEEAMAKYCKTYWNRGGAASPEKYLADWKAWKQK